MTLEGHVSSIFNVDLISLYIIVKKKETLSV